MQKRAPSKHKNYHILNVLQSNKSIAKKETEHKATTTLNQKFPKASAMKMFDNMKQLIIKLNANIKKVSITKSSASMLSNEVPLLPSPSPPIMNNNFMCNENKYYNFSFFMGHFDHMRLFYKNLPGYST